jgi:O-methyltransferase
MPHRFKTAQRWLAQRGLIVQRAGTFDNYHFSHSVGRHLPADFTSEWLAVIDAVWHKTLTTPERVAALCSATEYATARGIEGAIVECGVWKGGSMMAVALTLKRLGIDRELYLYDTYGGMSRPSERDRDRTGRRILDDWPYEDEISGVGAISLDEVKTNLSSTGYPERLLHFIPGLVEQTIPGQAPSQIAILRLDTDWYESTKHELEHLYPRLAPGGIMIIDDYGEFEGSRAAVDEYFAHEPVMLNRIDSAARLVVKR